MRVRLSHIFKHNVYYVPPLYIHTWHRIEDPRARGPCCRFAHDFCIILLDRTALQILRYELKRAHPHMANVSLLGSASAAALYRVARPLLYAMPTISFLILLCVILIRVVLIYSFSLSIIRETVALLILIVLLRYVFSIL